jgi:hypothetical protein
LSIGGISHSIVIGPARVLPSSPSLAPPAPVDGQHVVERDRKVEGLLPR